MTYSENAPQWSSLSSRIVLFALLLICGVANTTNAQEIVKGTFALNAETRIGSTVLPAGEYTVLVQPLTFLTSASSRVLVFVRPDSKNGPVASVFALASQEGCETPSGLKLVSDGTGLVARSLCLGKQGIMIDFDLSRASEMSKIKTTVSLRP